MIWSACASITLLFLTSTSSLPSVPVPPTGYSLGLETIFARSTSLDLAALTPHTPHTPLIAAPALTSSPDQFHLRPRAERRLPPSDRYLDRLPFGREIRGAAQRYELDSLLLASIVEAESSFRPDAVSNKGALGLMQLMPLHFAPRDPSDPTIAALDPLDPAVNLNLGARYLRDLRKRYDGDLELALAAYHAGPGTIDRFGGFPPYRETEAYVGRVLKLYSEHQREAGAATSATASSTSPAGSLPRTRTETRLGS